MSIRILKSPGIAVVFLAQAGALIGCGGDTGDGDPGDREQEGYDWREDCGDAAYEPRGLRVKNGWNTEAAKCAVTVFAQVEDDESSQLLECAASGLDCSCAYNSVRQGTALTLSVQENGEELEEIGPLQWEPAPEMVCGAYAGFAFSDFIYEKEAGRASIDALEKTLRDSASIDSCESAKDCGALAIGSKPCGGPWEYLIYSKLGSDEASLVAQADALAKAEDEYNLTSGAGSDCAFAEEPAVECSSNQCLATDPSIGMAVPTFGTYCTDVSDCGARETCKTDFRGERGICTSECDSTSDCSESAECAGGLTDYNGQVFDSAYCLLPCDVDTDCPGSECEPEQKYCL